MTNWATLKTAIANAIKSNGNHEITGQILQNTLNAIVSSVGENATFAGIATPTTSPGTPDGPVFYFAAVSGAYPNFDMVRVSKASTAILVWDSTLKKWNVQELSQQNGNSINNGITLHAEKGDDDSYVNGVRWRFKPYKNKQTGVTVYPSEKYYLCIPPHIFNIISDETGTRVDTNYKLLFFRGMTNRISQFSKWNGTDENGRNLWLQNYSIKNTRGFHWVKMLRNINNTDSEGDVVVRDNRPLTYDFINTNTSSPLEFSNRYGYIVLDITCILKDFFENIILEQYIKTLTLPKYPELPTTLKVLIRKSRTRRAWHNYECGRVGNSFIEAIAAYICNGIAIYDSDNEKLISNIHAFKTQIKYKVLDSSNVNRYDSIIRAITFGGGLSRTARLSN